MVVLALVLLILVVILSVAIVVSNPTIYDLSLFRVLIPVTSSGVYFTGAGAAVLTVIALLLLRLGIRRSRERHQRLKAAEQAAIGSASRTTPATTPPSDHPDASSGPTSNLELDQPTALTPAERQAPLDDGDEVSRDEPKQ